MEIEEKNESKTKFRIVARGFFGEGKELVASIRSDHKASIAQCVHAQFGDKIKPMFLSNAIMFDIVEEAHGIDVILDVIQQLQKFLAEKRRELEDEKNAS